MATDIPQLPSYTKFNWRIENFSKLNAKDGTCSDIFYVGSFKWKAQIYPKGDSKVYDKDRLTLYLRPVFLTKSVDAEFSIAVISQTYPSIRMKRELKYEFSEKTSGWGWPKFMHLSELHDPDKGYLVNDTCVITVEVSCTTKKESKEEEEVYPNKVAETEKEKNIVKEMDDKTSSKSGDYPGGRIYCLMACFKK